MRRIMTLCRYPTMVFGMATTLLVLSACGDDSGGVGLSQGSGSGGANSAGSAGTGSFVGSGNGSGNPTGSGTGAGGNNGCGSVLTGLYRDFMASHPDFEGVLGFDPGIVQQD